MDPMIRAMFDKNIRPNRAQYLVVSDSKHLFLRGDHEQIDHQKKELDPRTCGSRKMVTRLIAVDEDTGVFYGELWPRDEIDLIGFLARAWSTKDKHPMRGSPELLYVPGAVAQNKELLEQVRIMARFRGAMLEPSPAGFGPATVACREYERSLLHHGAGAYDKSGRMPLMVAHQAANLLSMMACFSAIQAFDKHWSKVDPMSEHAIREIDGLYDPIGAWRQHEFASFIQAPEAQGS